MAVAPLSFGRMESSLNTSDDAPLHENVYQEIRRNLMAGQFQPGEAVTLRGLAGKLGTSAMPVREALRRLVAERALDLGPNRTARVPVVTSVRSSDSSGRTPERIVTSSGSRRWVTKREEPGFLRSSSA